MGGGYGGEAVPLAPNVMACARPRASPTAMVWRLPGRAGGWCVAAQKKGPGSGRDTGATRGPLAPFPSHPTRAPARPHPGPSRPSKS